MKKNIINLIKIVKDTDNNNNNKINSNIYIIKTLSKVIESKFQSKFKIIKKYELQIFKKDSNINTNNN